MTRYQKSIVNITFFIAIFGSVYGCSNPDLISKNNTKVVCLEIYQLLQSCASEFIKDAMSYSDPFAVCSNNATFNFYRWTMLYYEKLRTSQEETKDNQIIPCGDQYLNKNRMGIIVKTMQDIKSVWEQANCDNCYKDINVVGNFSDDTLKFFKLHDDYDSCVKNAKIQYPGNYTALCNTCVDSYGALNNVYDAIKDRFGYYKICFDIQDKMNKTRLEWSGQFACCHEKQTDLTAFYVTTGVLLLAIVGFYLAAFIIGMKNSNEHLDAGDIRSEDAVPQSTSNSIIRRALRINGDESSDDEPLVTDTTHENRNDLVDLRD